MSSRVRFAFVASSCALLALACSVLRDLDEYAVGGNSDAGPGDALAAQDTGVDDAPSPLPLPDARNDTGACTADIATDANNCGRCGHSCLGGTCSQGRCQAQVLVGSEAQPTYLALHDDRVMYKAIRKFGSFDNEALVSVPLTGGAPSTQVTGLDGPGSTPGLSTHQGFSYFFAFCTLKQRAKSNGAEKFVTSCGNTHHPVAGDTAVYMAKGDNVFKGNYTAFADTPDAGLGPIKSLGGFVVDLAAADAGVVAAVDGGVVDYLRYADNTEVQLATQQGNLVAVAGRHDVAVWARVLAGKGAIVRRALKDPAPTVLADDQPGPLAVVMDDVHAYFLVGGGASTGGELRRVPLAGGTVETLVTGLNRPAFVAVDATHAYFTTRGTSLAAADGQVLRVAK